MFHNLAAEMARAGLTRRLVAEKAAINDHSLKNKLQGKTEFTRREMLNIKKNCFPEMSLDYLFEWSDGGEAKSTA